MGVVAARDCVFEMTVLRLDNRVRRVGVQFLVTRSAQLLAVVDAARTLFVERGYVATTIEAISDHSDVPAATVYDQPRAVQERPHVAALFTEPDARKLLAGFAGVTTAINQRTNAVYRVLESAAGSDLAAAELLREIQQQRDRGQGQIARSLSRAHALKPGLRQRDAADLIHTLMSPEVYRLLVDDRGWTPARYQGWLATTLTQQLT